MSRATLASGALPPHLIRGLESLGFGLKAARVRRGITVREMADKIFVTPRTVVRLEKGDPTVRLGIFVTAAWILGFDRKLWDVFDASRDASGIALDLARLPTRADKGRKRPRPRAAGGEQ